MAILTPPPSGSTVEQAKERAVTQAFVAGQMDAQLKHADDLTRPSLALLKERAYALALETQDELIAAVRAESAQEIERLKARVKRIIREQADHDVEYEQALIQRAEAAEAELSRLKGEQA